MGVRLTSLTMKAFLSLSAVVALTSGAPQYLNSFNPGYFGVGVGVGVPTAVGVVARPAVGVVASGPVGLGGGYVNGGVGIVGRGQASHQSLVKPLQGENRGVAQTKAFGAPVAAVSDHQRTLHGAHANRIGPVGVVAPVVAHAVAPVATVGVVGHGVGFGHGVGIGHGVGLGHGVIG